MELGEKIKNARIKAGMTQSTLAGDKITRNMLSQIENGKAKPSLETVEHISEMLGLSPDYFLGDKSEGEYRKDKYMGNLRSYFAKKKYKDAISYFDKNVKYEDDETAYILAYCYFETGKKKLHDGYPESAQKDFSAAEKYCEKTIYDTDSLLARITLYKAISSNIQSPRLELDTEKYEKYLKSSCDEEIYRYLTEETKYDYKNEILGKFAEARAYMKSGDFTRASESFLELDNSKGVKDIPSFVLFRIYSELETCFREIRNFEMAYKYSSKRIALISAFNM